jgi:UDP:flavonoid glycosyltransferase YjiC (YdhE family)
MPTFLLACHDAGGTVPPILALTEALVDRRHDVVVLSQRSVRGRAEALGAGFVAFSEIPSYKSRRPLEEQFNIVVPAMTGKAVGDDIVALTNERGVDAIVVDANLAGGLAAAETLSRPSIVLLHSMYKTYVDTWFGELWPLLAPAVNHTRAAFGLGDAHDWPSVFAAHDRMFAVVPAAFDAPVAEVPDAMRHFGFLTPRRQAENAAFDFPEGDDPTVLVGLSTTYQQQEPVLDAILEALASLAVRALVTTAGQVDIDGLSARSNVTIADYVPHALVLDHTDVMVTHAGLGSIAAAMTFGVPVVCIPHGRDQPLNAQRVSAHGAGVALTELPRAAEIAAAIEGVLATPSARDATRALAAMSRAEGGADAAVAELESLLG